MSAPLRALLIDCRIAVRRAGGSDAAALGARLEQTIRELDRGALQLGTPPASSSASGSNGSGPAGSHQVALAWQSTCRGLMLSHPQLYGELRDKVMALLDVRELQDPGAELLRAENQVRELEAERRALQARLDDLGQRAAETQSALTVVREALDEACREMPEGERRRDPHEHALAQVAWLLAQRGSAVAATRQAASAAPVVEGPVPTRAILRAVAARQRVLSAEQRDWVIGEALGVTGWQYTPVELLAKGEPWLAERLLESASLPPE